MFYLLECARGHTIALLEILVEIGTVVVAYFVANLFDAHTRVLCEHSACLFEPESVSPCPEVGSEYVLHIPAQKAYFNPYFEKNIRVRHVLP